MNGLSSLGLGASVIRIFVSAVDDAPELFKHAKEIFEEIASKDDGLVKITKIAATFAAMAGHAANAGHVAASDGASQPIEVLKPELRPTVQDTSLTDPEKVEAAAPPLGQQLDKGKVEAAAQTEAPPMGALPQDSPVSGPAPSRVEGGGYKVEPTVTMMAPAGTGSPGAETGPAGVGPVAGEVLGPGPVAPPAGGSGQIGPTVTIRGHQYPVDAQGNVILNAADRLALEQDDKPL